MTKQKRWPNNAERARQDALSYARRGVNAISPILTDGVRKEDFIKRAAITNDSLHRIIACLMEVGPQQAEQKAPPGVNDPKEAEQIDLVRV